MSWLSELFSSGSSSDTGAGSVDAALAKYLATQANPPPAVQDANAAVASGQDQASRDALAAQVAAADRKRGNVDAALGQVRGYFPDNYENTVLPDTIDDPSINKIYGKQRGDADAFISNMLKRGVITPTGFGAASKNLDEQGGRVRGQLGDIGSTLIGGERDKLAQIIGRARESASGLGPDDTFNATPFANEASTSIADWSKSLPDAFASRLPAGNLFDTSGLSSIAGAAQGAQNLPFDPGATSSNVKTTKNDVDPFAPKPKKPGAAAVF